MNVRFLAWDMPAVDALHVTRRLTALHLLLHRNPSTSDVR